MKKILFLLFLVASFKNPVEAKSASKIIENKHSVYFENYKSLSKKQRKSIEKKIIKGVVSDFKKGFEFRNKISNCVAIFGSCNIAEDNKYCLLAENLVKKLAEKGIGVVTGAGKGIMKIANKTAKENKADSFGICLKTEQRSDFLDEYKAVELNNLFARKYFFKLAVNAFVCFPGGFGTFDELFEMITIIRSQKNCCAEVFLVDKEFWGPILKAAKERFVSIGIMEEHQEMPFTFVEDLDSIVNKILVLTR